MLKRKTVVAVLGVMAVFFTVSLTSGCKFNASYDGKWKNGVCVPTAGNPECTVTVGVADGEPVPGVI